MPSISARISEEDEEVLEKVAELLAEDKSTVIRKALREGLSDLRVRVAIERYQSGEVSTNQAARLAGVSIAEWLDIAREHNLTSQLSPDDLEADAEVTVDSSRERPVESGGIHIDDVFGTNEDAPYETQRRISRYLSQETRYHIIQSILGHPTHLPSLTELDYYIPKSRSAIREQLDNLKEHHVIAKYTHAPNEDARDLSADFWGLTPFGINLLFEYKYLRGVPIMRALHDHTHKTDQIKRHETAPRPSLPDAVAEALAYDEPDIEDADTWDGEETVEELRETSIFGDAAPADSDTTDDRSLEELF